MLILATENTYDFCYKLASWSKFLRYVLLKKVFGVTIFCKQIGRTWNPSKFTETSDPE